MIGIPLASSLVYLFKIMVLLYLPSSDGEPELGCIAELEALFLNNLRALVLYLKKA